MDVSKNKANITMQFSANIFPIKMTISPKFHFCPNAHLNFLVMSCVLTSLPN